MLQKLFNLEWQITSKFFLLTSFLIGFSFSPTAKISRLELEFEESLLRKTASKGGLDRSQMEQPIKKNKFSYFARSRLRLRPQEIWERDYIKLNMMCKNSKNCAKRFGFNIRGGVDHPHVGSDPGIFITTVRADSTAGVDGRLEPGDRILALNATSLECVTHDVAVNEFRKVEESVWLLLEKNAEAQLLTQQVPKSPEETVTDGPLIPCPCEEEPPNPVFSLLKQFYESKLGALSIGLAVGSLAVFVALRIYKAAK